jgi:ABC-type multidrug transport system fused ATPase/permease subunit
MLCLMRLVEPDLSDSSAEHYAPPIEVDGIDVLRIGLRELRSNIGIIPQNPVLFSGTIRSNVDPFDQYSDEDVWSALERCGMKPVVLGMPDQLGAPVAEYGANLSQGQRQLLCLGRALLRNVKILLLDEATSSLDFETDREVQRTIREAFSDSTVLTIAHRVNTIMDSDKILVMKDGVAAEFGSPEDLMRNESSLFVEIVRHSESDESS